MFSKFFGKCLPSRRGKNKDDTVIGAHEDPKARTLAKGETKEDVSPSPTEEKSIEDELDQDTTVEDIILKKVESDEGQTEEGRDPEPVSEETLKAADGESNTDYAADVESLDPQVDEEEEDYNWEISCCGVDMPMSKE